MLTQGKREGSTGYLWYEVHFHTGMKLIPVSCEQPLTSHWFFTCEVTYGYHHVDIRIEHQKYLSFARPFHGAFMRYCTFTVFPLALTVPVLFY